MPAFVGGVKFIDLADGIISVGDAFILAPKSVQSVSFGAGGSSKGDFTREKSLFSISNFYDCDIADQQQMINK